MVGLSQAKFGGALPLVPSPSEIRGWIPAYARLPGLVTVADLASQESLGRGVQQLRVVDAP